MAEVLIFKFPDLIDENRTTIEHEVCGITTAYRNGERLPPEVLDWADSANSWLDASASYY